MTRTDPGTAATRAVIATLAVAATLVAAGCGVVSGGPPPVTVRGAGEPVDLAPWTSCWSGLAGGGCADGAPPADPPDVGAAEQVEVSFPEPGWTFSATFRPAGQPCARAQQVDLEGRPPGLAPSTSGGTIVPVGPAGTYDVDVFGSGAKGDVVITFRWTTPVDGPAPVPDATVAVLEARDGQVEGYGVSLTVSDLAAPPERASAHVVVTSSEGASLALDPRLEVGTCSSEGSVWFSGSYEEGEQAAALGSAPFTCDITLVMDGVEHRARATWPDGEVLDPDGAPTVPLRFIPPLPAVAP